MTPPVDESVPGTGAPRRHTEISHLTSADGTVLAYHRLGDASGDPLVCLPGGPMQDCTYLGDLGGLADHRPLVMLDHRGTGRSQTPADPSSYRCDRLVDDVDALREQLGLERIDLLGHSAGTNLAALYTARYGSHVRRLLMITPSTFAFGTATSGATRQEIVELRRDQPWFAAASAAFTAIRDDRATDDDWAAIAPFTYGRWDAAAQQHHRDGLRQRNDRAAEVYGSDGAFDPPGTRAALADFTGPVLLVAGEVDIAAAPRVVGEIADVFANPTVVVLPGAGHFPWLDDPVAFRTAVTDFLVQ